MTGSPSAGIFSIPPGSWMSYYYCITKYSKHSLYFAPRFCGSGIQAGLDWAVLTAGHARGCSQVLAEAAGMRRFNWTRQWNGSLTWLAADTRDWLGASSGLLTSEPSHGSLRAVGLLQQTKAPNASVLAAKVKSSWFFYDLTLEAT